MTYVVTTGLTVLALRQFLLLVEGYRKMSIFAELKNSTSDHAWQSIRVVDEDPNGQKTEIRGVTWNLLNQGFAAKTPTSFSNNPFNLDETDADYIYRKTCQMMAILFLIKHFELKGDTLDFMFLQEVNIFTAAEINRLPALKDVTDQFKKSLAELDWEFAITTRELGCKALVTLYNKNTLQLNNTTPAKSYFQDKAKKKNTAFELNFTHQGTKRAVALTNLHLDYDKIYFEEMIQKQFELIKRNTISVMGGDCNHPPTYGIRGVVGDCSKATNIARCKDIYPDLGNLTDLDERFSSARNDVKMHYDCFFCGPGGAEHTISAEKMTSSYFTVENRNLAIVDCYEPRTEKQHTLQPALQKGMPWCSKEDEAFYLPHMSSLTAAPQGAVAPILAPVSVGVKNPKPVAKMPTPTASTTDNKVALSRRKMLNYLLLVANGLMLAAVLIGSLSLTTMLAAMFVGTVVNAILRAFLYPLETTSAPTLKKIAPTEALLSETRALGETYDLSWTPLGAVKLREQSLKLQEGVETIQAAARGRLCR